MNTEPVKRLFIGIPVDAACQQQLDDGIAGLKGTNAVSWLPARNRHLTLAFIGDVRADILLLLQEQFADAYQGSHGFSFGLNELARFPGANGHILAAVHSPSLALQLLHEQTQDLLTQCGLPVGKLQFLPHISLGKIHKNFKEDLHQPVQVRLLVDRVSLYESSQSGDGRLYTVLNERLL